MYKKAYTLYLPSITGAQVTDPEILYPWVPKYTRSFFNFEVNIKEIAF